MNNYMEIKKFKDINLTDSFFDSLKSDYSEFENWFIRKRNNNAYVIYENKQIQGFLYLKIEEGPITDIVPAINKNRVLKIGTLKINPHGTRLGERFIKKVLDHAIISLVDLCYVTIFEKHTALVDLFYKYGFLKHGEKNTHNGTELVLIKDLKDLRNDILLDYPLVNTSSVAKYLLAIYPDYHTKMFPDSILRNESFDILEDVSHTNSIHKIYVCGMPVFKANRGDLIVIYRTSDNKAPAEYRSVATSICVVEEVKSRDNFMNFNDFYDYANAYSIFDRNALQTWYNKNSCYTIKMTYNAALTKRLTRQKLADQIGLNRNARWSFLRLTDEQFKRILEIGEVNEGIIIN